MRKPLFLLSLLLIPGLLHAQNYLTITQKNGDEFSFGFTDKPVVTYTESDLVLTTEKTSVEFPLESLLKFTFTDQPTDVPTVETRADLKVWDNTVLLTGLGAETQVQLVAIDGKVVATYKATTEGRLYFSIAELPAGTYIIKSDSINCKILKK